MSIVGLKYRAIRLALLYIKKIAVHLQVGNPALKAPTEISKPDKANIISVIKGDRDEEDVCVWKLKNVICSGLYGGAILNEFNQVYLRFIIYPWGKNLHPIFTLPYIGNKLAVIDKAVLALTVASNGNYYHWIADFLPRMLLIKKSIQKDFEDRLIIIHPNAKKYEEETLRLLEINNDKILRLPAYMNLNVVDLIIADNIPSIDGNIFPKWKMKLIHEFRNTYIQINKKREQKRIYLVRGKQKTRNLIGEELLIEVLEKEGFQILYPQSMTLLDQMISLSDAKIVIALHGAALSNILFCKENTIIIELRSSHLPPDYFYQISKTCNLQFECIELLPAKKLRARHHANKQDLILSNKDIFNIKKRLTSVY